MTELKFMERELCLLIFVEHDCLTAVIEGSTLTASVDVHSTLYA